VNARASWADRPAIASTPTSTSTIQAHPRERAGSSLLPRCCCGPCLPPRRLRCGTCTARRRRLSSRRPSNRPKARRPASASRGVRGTMGVRTAPSPRCTRAAQRSVPPTRGARLPRSGSSARAGKPKMATPATSSTPSERATRRRGKRWATTLDGVGATIAGRTAHQRRSHQEPACSARRSAWRASPNASASTRRSTSTTEKRSPAYGSTTTAWRVSRVGPPPTRLSSVTSPCTSLTRRGRGSSTYLPARSTTGTIWSTPSWELPGHVRAPWKLLGSACMHTEARRIAKGLHAMLLQALHGAPERGSVRNRACLPRGHHVPGSRV
jgi:hypothetical protein